MSVERTHSSASEPFISNEACLSTSLRDSTYELSSVWLRN